MSGTLKLGILLIVGVFAAGLVLKVAAGLISLIQGILALIVPLAIVAGVGLLLYGLINRKSLGGGSRRLLP
ncbi:MAG: hypothetical protein SNJ74_11790 [Fimbriimonadaceae bacterium]